MVLCLRRRRRRRWFLPDGLQGLPCSRAVTEQNDQCDYMAIRKRMHRFRNVRARVGKGLWEVRVWASCTNVRGERFCVMPQTADPIRCKGEGEIGAGLIHTVSRVHPSIVSSMFRRCLGETKSRPRHVSPRLCHAALPFHRAIID